MPTFQWIKWHMIWMVQSKVLEKWCVRIANFGEFVGSMAFFFAKKQGALFIQHNMITILSEKLRHTPWILKTPHRKRFGAKSPMG